MKLVIKGKSLASLRLCEKPLADWKFEVAYIRQKQTLATQVTSELVLRSSVINQLKSKKPQKS